MYIPYSRDVDVLGGVLFELDPDLGGGRGARTAARGGGVHRSRRWPQRFLADERAPIFLFFFGKDLTRFLP